MAGPSSRPDRLVLVTGTGTDVGKTWITARVAALLTAEGRRVAARKPAQSYEPGSGSTDSEVLAAATGEQPEDVCLPHRCYELPMAPFMAADALRRNPFTLGDLLRELSWPVPTDVGFLESAGGVRSPITSDGADSIDLADAISPELVLLVADAGLGTISAVRLCLSALSEHRTAVILNQYQSHHELHRRNRDWLREHFVGLPVLTDLNHVGRLIYE